MSEKRYCKILVLLTAGTSQSTTLPAAEGKDWRNELFLLENLKVPRCSKPSEFGMIVSVQLHCMSDASKYGYGHCSYVRLEDKKGNAHVSFEKGSRHTKDGQHPEAGIGGCHSIC